MRTTLGWLSVVCLLGMLYATESIPSSRSNCPATAGSTDICYATTGILDGGRLLRINLATGQATLLADVEGATRVNSAAIASNGDLFGSRDGTGTDSLCHIDVGFGTTCCVALPRTNGLAFGPGDQLFGVINNVLLKIDPVNGDTTHVGATNIPVPVTGMAFDPIDQSLFACTRTELFKLNVNSGQSSSVGIIADSVAVSDIVFDSQGRLFATTGGGQDPNNRLLRIDKFTAAPTFIGATGFTAVSGLTLLSNVVVSDGSSVLPSTHRLHGNHPNPFNPRTSIRFDLPSVGHVHLEILDVRGQLVRRLIDGEYRAGRHAVDWDGKDDNGRSLAAGVYVYRIRTAAFEASGRMVMVK